MKRNILLHCHFFKNAGTSIDWALMRNFKTSFHENKKHFYSVADWDDHLRHLLYDQTLQAISSHIFSLRPPEVSGVKFYLIAMFRHPIERVTSVAAYEKKQEYLNSLGTITDTNIGLREYVAAYLKDGTPASIRNIHTLRFAGRDNGCPVSDDDLARAVATVSLCQTIGVVEFFDESMVLFEEILQPVFPGLDLSYIKQNENQPPQSVDERIKSLKEQLGGDLYEMLVEKNAMDMKLYEIVKLRFHERIGAMSGFSLKLKLFRDRCHSLHV
jgi:hypothetical protein